MVLKIINRILIEMQTIRIWKLNRWFFYQKVSTFFKGYRKVSPIGAKMN